MKALVKEIILNGLIYDLIDKKIEIDIEEEVKYTEYFGGETMIDIDTTPLSPIIKDIPIRLPLKMFVIRTVDGTFVFSDRGWERA